MDRMTNDNTGSRGFAVDEGFRDHVSHADGGAVE